MNSIGTYTLFDRVIDITFYTERTFQDRAPALWEIDGQLTESDTVTTSDGLVYSKQVHGYIPDITIHCNDQGLKPDIQLSFGLVPGRNVTKCEVSITNLQVNLSQIRSWALMKITAGYRGIDASYGKTTLYVNIFSAWNESPNPDGVTKIQGVATGSALGVFFGPKSFYLQYNLDKIRIRDLLQRLLNDPDVIEVPTFHEDVELTFLNKNITIADDSGKKVSKKIGDIDISLERVRMYAENGYQIIQWLGRELYSWGKQYGIFVYLTVFNDRVRINCFTEDEGDPGEDVVELNVVDGANFTGKYLTVKAPWAPSLIPGGLFHLPAKYFSLQNTYRELGLSEITDVYKKDGKSIDRGIYRVITMDVLFDTVGKNNTMSISAVPYSSSEDPWNTSTESELIIGGDKNIDQKRYEQLSNSKGLFSTIVIGETAVQKEGRVTQGSFWSKIAMKSISGVKDQTVYLDFIPEVEDEEAFGYQETSFNFTNWYDLWCKYTYGADLGSTTEEDMCTYPVLKPSEMKKIADKIEAEGVQVSDALLFNLKQGKSFEMPADSLWILYFIYAYIKSVSNNDWLYKTVDKATIGEVLTSPFNYPLTDRPDEFFMAQRQSVSSTTTEERYLAYVYTTPIKTASGDKYRQRVSCTIPKASPVKEYKSKKEGGQRSYYSKLYKPFVDVMKLVIEDQSLRDHNQDRFDWDLFVVWYFFLKEVA